MKRFLMVPLVCVGLSLPITGAGADFGGYSAGYDETVSLGQFGIRLSEEKGQEILGIPNCPDMDTPAEDSPCFWLSPVLIDTSTRIGRSEGHSDEDTTDTEGAKIGCEVGEDGCAADGFMPELVKDDDLEPFPATGDKFVEGPADTKEIHTQILHLNMIHDRDLCNIQSANAVRAGSAAPQRKRSLGEIESLNQGGDFPAESFFNMFVEVDVDWNLDGTVDMTVYNLNIPLTVQNDQVNSFPPDVVYIHGGSQNDGAPPVYDVTTGQLVGWITLAGHSLEKGKSCSEENANGGFASFLEGVREKETLLAVTMRKPFTAKPKNGAVKLEWETGIEKDNAGFEVWRGQPIGGQCSTNPNNYTDVQAVAPWVDSQGTEVSGATYTRRDESVVPGNTYCYVLGDIDFNGKRTLHWDNIVSATSH